MLSVPVLGGSACELGESDAQTPKPTLAADIRTGDCSTSGTRQYPLNVVDGQSDTVVDVPLRELLDRGYIVWIGDFAQDGPLCGDFFGAEEN